MCAPWSNVVDVMATARSVVGVSVSQHPLP